VALRLDGRAAAAALRERLGQRIVTLGDRGVTPGLAMIRVGEDRASAVYVRAKEKAAREVGIDSRVEVLPAESTQAQVAARLRAHNADPAVHGILLQLPLPAPLEADPLLASIDPEKDVDGFHPISAGRLCLGLPGFVSATPLGILRLLQHYEIETAGRRVVILGRSRIVGRPLANLLSTKGPAGDATVTLCHSRTRDLPAVTRSGEILVAAIGRRHFVGPEMVAPGATVIDVGMHSEPDPARPGKRRLYGDVDTEAVAVRRPRWSRRASRPAWRRCGSRGRSRTSSPTARGTSTSRSRIPPRSCAARCSAAPTGGCASRRATGCSASPSGGSPSTSARGSTS
jgi:methylenetetrahydrofolate dehydrogenase (NADP+)/methenyltetrahydrofolate cyclohydrolase